MKKFFSILFVSVCLSVSFCFAQGLDLGEYNNLISQSKYYSAEKWLCQKLKTCTDYNNLELLMKEYSALRDKFDEAETKYQRNFFIPVIKDAEEHIHKDHAYDFQLTNFSYKEEKGGKKRYYLVSNLVPSMELAGITEKVVVPYQNSYKNSWSEFASWPKYYDFYTAETVVQSKVPYAFYDGKVVNPEVAHFEVKEAYGTVKYSFYKIKISILSKNNEVLYKSPKLLVKQGGNFFLDGISERAVQEMNQGLAKIRLDGVWLMTGIVPVVDFGFSEDIEEQLYKILMPDSTKTVDEMEADELYLSMTKYMSKADKLQTVIDHFNWDKWSKDVTEVEQDVKKYKLYTSKEQVAEFEKQYAEFNQKTFSNINAARTEKIESQLTKEQAGNVSFEMVAVPAGEAEIKYYDSYSIKSSLSSFSIARYETTVELVEAVTGHKFESVANKKNAAKISWDDAIAFCNLLSMKAGLTPCYSINGQSDPAKWDYKMFKEQVLPDNLECNYYADGYRLPTMAEWVRASSYKEPSKKYSYNINTSVTDWLDSSFDNEKPVGLKVCNDLGLFDMQGNVNEWCADSEVKLNEITFKVKPSVNFTYADFEDSEKIYCGENSSLFKEIVFSSATRQYASCGLRLIRSTKQQATERKTQDSEYAEKLNAVNKELKSRLEEYVKNSYVYVPGSYGVKFLMWKTEVTQDIYAAVMGNLPKKIASQEIQYDLPVYNVTWVEAVTFCNKLSDLYGFEPCYSVEGKTDCDQWAKDVKPEDVEYDKNKNGFRLPLKDEWETAAYGSGYSSYKYAGTNNLEQSAWYKNNSKNKLHKVAQKEPNAIGLYDMCGNVAEMCEDRFTSYGSIREVVKGGSYKDSDYYCEVKRDDDISKYSDEDTGFRIAANFSEYYEKIYEEQERIKKEEAERVEKERIEKELALKQEQERLEQERKEKERKEKELALQKEKERKEQLERERLEKQRIEKELELQREQERLEQEKLTVIETREKIKADIENRLITFKPLFYFENNKYRLMDSFKAANRVVTEKDFAAINNEYSNAWNNNQKVSYMQAVQFCNNLSDLIGLERYYDIKDNEIIEKPNALGYRLLTDREYEGIKNLDIYSKVYYFGAVYFDDEINAQCSKTSEDTCYLRIAQNVTESGIPVINKDYLDKFLSTAVTVTNGTSSDGKKLKPYMVSKNYVTEYFYCSLSPEIGLSFHETVYGDGVYQYAEAENVYEFLNKLSTLMGYEPCFKKNKKGLWEMDTKKNGFRLPTMQELEACGHPLKENYYFNPKTPVEKYTKVVLCRSL